MFLILLTFCVGTVQEIKVVVGCFVSPFYFVPLVFYLALIAVTETASVFKVTTLN